MPELNRKNLLKLFLVAIGCIFVYWLLHDAERVKGFVDTVSDVAAPFVFGGVLAFILNVPMRAIENKVLKKLKNNTLKRVLAVIFTFFAMLLVVGLVFWLLIPQIIKTINSLIPTLYVFFANAQKFVYNVLGERPELMDWLKANTDFENIKWDTLVKDALSVFGNSVSAIVSGAVSALSSIFAGVFDAVIAIVFSVYCLFQKETLARQGRKLLYAFTKEQTADKIIRVLRLTNSTFSNFLSGQCVEVCILGSLFAVSMAIFRMPYIPLISVVIAVTAFIPIVGAWVGCVLGAFLILVVNPTLAVWFVIMFLIIQQIENNMIYPRVVGTSVGLSGMWVLLAVSVGGELMGVVGMFLMIPVASVIYTLVRELTNKKLETTSVDSEKLQPQPPELSSKLKEKREESRKKSLIKKVKTKEKK